MCDRTQSLRAFLSSFILLFHDNNDNRDYINLDINEGNNLNFYR